MSIEDDQPKSRTVEIPTKHLGVGGVLVAAILVLNPVKEFFVTREEAVAQGQRIERLEISVLELKRDLTATVNGNSLMIMDHIKESRAQWQRDIDRQEKRIDSLEAFRRELVKTKSL